MAASAVLTISDTSRRKPIAATSVKEKSRSRRKLLIVCRVPLLCRGGTSHIVKGVVELDQDTGSPEEESEQAKKNAEHAMRRTTRPFQQYLNRHRARGADETLYLFYHVCLGRSGAEYESRDRYGCKE